MAMSLQFDAVIEATSCQFYSQISTRGGIKPHKELCEAQTENRGLAFCISAKWQKIKNEGFCTER